MNIFIYKCYYCSKCNKWLSEKDVFQECSEVKGKNYQKLIITSKCRNCRTPIFMEVVVKIE